MLLALGWAEGLPTAAQLTSHILDRLEDECACDIADEAGAAGEALHAGASRGRSAGGEPGPGGPRAVSLGRRASRGDI